MLNDMERSNFSMLCRVAILLLFGLSCSVHADDDHAARAQYIANTGVMISRGDTHILFDPLFSNTFGVYDAVPPDIQTALLAGNPPWDDVDAVFISHHHEDHLDPALILKLLRQHTAAELYAPEQAALAIRELVNDPGDPVLQRVHGLGLESGASPRRLSIGELLIDAVRIPHEGWPNYHADVENIVFRVTLDETITVMHFGDADPDDTHFAKHSEYWQERHTDFAMPPYWFFLRAAGVQILDERIDATHTVGVHVPAEVPDAPRDRPDELRGFDLFTQPGEVRRIDDSPEQ